MAKTLENYDPLVQIPSGMTPAGADFPIVESHDILVGENDKRLDAKLDDIDSAIGNVGQTPIATQLSSKVNTGDIVTSVAATGSTSNNKIPSETAVRAAIEAKTINVDSTVTEGSTNAVSGGAVHTQLATKQDTLTFDTTPTVSSSNPVTSGGVKTALDAKQDTLTFDTTPTVSSSNPVTSGGVKAALDNKQNTLTYETTPIVGSVNPVTSTGIRNAIDTAAAGNLGQMQAQYDEFVADAEDVLDRAASLSNGMVACSNIAAETTVGDTRILLYTGTTNANYTNGHWYYNSAASNAAPVWTDGGAVGSAPTIDNTLTTAGAAADSKSVGDAIENIVTISDTQPGSNSGNKVWIKETTDEEVQIPTYEEHISKSNKADIATNNESDNGSGTITASKAYAIGDHFYINNTNTSSENYGVSTLYKATAAIASGDAIVVGTNCEASKVADEITSLSNDLGDTNDRLNSFFVLHAIHTDWEQGYIRNNNGTIGSDSKSCTSGYIESGGFTITLTVGASYRTKVAHYNSSKEFVEILLSSSAGDREVIVPAGDFVRVQVSSDSDISPSDITDMVISLNERRYTDTYAVKTSGKPADAKEVFDFFDCLANISLDSLSVAVGYYSITNGVIGSDGRYAKTTKLKQSSSRIVFASIGAGYKFAVRMWDENNTFVPEKASSYSTTYQGVVPNGWTIAFNFENNEVSTLDNTDYEAIKSAFNVRMSSGSEFVVSTIGSPVDFNDFTETGTYRLPSTMSGTHANAPTDEYGRLVVFGDVDNYSIVQLYISYKNNVYTRILQYRDTDVWADWAQIYNGVTGEIGAYLHDGNVLRMAGNPEAIPVNENHLGYNDFISATWANFLPDNYTDGDSYDASTTKIINVHVSRESDWMSTPYGVNEDIYPIYRYTFTPVNGYQKTVLLTAGCHGNEAEGYWGLYRLMRMIYFEGYKYPTLRNLRNNVRFIVVPSWNPWGMQHYRRYNAFESKSLQAWNWLFAEGNQINVNGAVYDITDVGEANVIWTTLQEFANNLDYWIDFHTDPYAGRTTSSGEIDDPRGYTPPYGFYGFTKNQTTTKYRLQGIMEDFYNLLKNEHDFTESWHLLGISPNPSGSGGFSPWMASLPFPTALIEVSTFMEGFPYASGSADMMKMAQEFYGSCLSEFLR